MNGTWACYSLACLAIPLKYVLFCRPPGRGHCVDYVTRQGLQAPVVRVPYLRPDFYTRFLQVLTTILVVVNLTAACWSFKIALKGPERLRVPDAPATKTLLAPEFRADDFYFDTSGCSPPMGFGGSSTKWCSDNVQNEEDGLHLILNKDVCKEYLKMCGTADYTGVQLRSTEAYSYGLMRIKLKMSSTPGTILGFFLYNFENKDEFDFEILDGRNIQTNCFRRGKKGYCKGELIMRSREIEEATGVIDFETKKEHVYEFAYSADTLTWWIDGAVIRTEANQGIGPHMSVVINLWANGDPFHWPAAGVMMDSSLPGRADIEVVEFHQHCIDPRQCKEGSGDSVIWTV